MSLKVNCQNYAKSIIYFLHYAIIIVVIFVIQQMVWIVELKLIKKCQVKHMSYLVCCILICVLLHVWMIRDIAKFLNNMTSIISFAKQHNELLARSKGTKYILLWNKYGVIIPRSGRDLFSSLNCSVSNCVLTENRGLLLGDYSRFDAIIFHHKYLNIAKERPNRRRSAQIYIFASIDSSSNSPACELFNDDFFNLTFTYRLDSDIVWNYFVVRNISGDIVAPSKTVVWNVPKYPIDKKIKTIIKGRSRAAAWLVSNCAADSLRDQYLTRVQEHLFHYSQQIDVYGHCSGAKCDNDNCEEMLRTKYYFYMAFENSFAEDYVTEKVLHGYDNYVVPIVFGGANYSRFLPPGSYINALDYHPYNLANVMYLAMQYPTKYEAYFQWTNFYTIVSDPKIYHPLCDLCKALNSEKFKHAPAKKQFRIWWNGLNGMKWCLPNEYWNETSKILIDGKHIYHNNLY